MSAGSLPRLAEATVLRGALAALPIVRRLKARTGVWRSAGVSVERRLRGAAELGVVKPANKRRTHGSSLIERGQGNGTRICTSSGCCSAWPTSYAAALSSCHALCSSPTHRHSMLPYEAPSAVVATSATSVELCTGEEEGSSSGYNCRVTASHVRMLPHWPASETPKRVLECRSFIACTRGRMLRTEKIQANPPPWPSRRHTFLACANVHV